MKMPVLSIFDSLIGYGTPFCEVNCEVAKRGFRNSIIALHEGQIDSANDPCDLSLYKIGEFDSDDGVITPCPVDLVVAGSRIVVEYQTADIRKDRDNEKI